MVSKIRYIHHSSDTVAERYFPRKEKTGELIIPYYDERKLFVVEENGTLEVYGFVDPKRFRFEIVDGREISEFVRFTNKSQQDAVSRRLKMRYPKKEITFPY